MLTTWSSLWFKVSRGPSPPTYFVLIPLWSQFSCYGKISSFALGTTVMAQIKVEAFIGSWPQYLTTHLSKTLQLGHATYSLRVLTVLLLIMLKYNPQAQHDFIQISWHLQRNGSQDLGSSCWLQISESHSIPWDHPISLYEDPWQYQALRVDARN